MTNRLIFCALMGGGIIASPNAIGNEVDHSSKAEALGTKVSTSENSNKTLLINEIMQSNIDCILDDLNNFPDSWVELINIGQDNVDLSEYSIGISSLPNKAFALPKMSIESGEKVVVYCDKEGSGLHTDFRLESGKGCEVYLFHAAEVVDFISDLKKQPAPNVAYGRITDGADKWGYMAKATPNEPNCGEIVTDLLPDPIFSVSGTISTNPFILTVSLPENAPKGAQIYYTLDGSEPNDESPLWTQDMYIENTTVIRAKLIADGYIVPRSVTHSYIFDNYESPQDLGFISIVTNDDYFYNPSLGIYIVGEDTSNPNYSQDWRRPVNIEYFNSKNQEASINQLCETKIKGGASRSLPLKSLVLYANKRFGEKRFNYEFFESTPGIDEFKSIELRNAGNDFYYATMRDAVIQESAGNQMGLDWQPHKNARVYLNGKYLGLLRIRPRSNEDHIEAFYKGLEDIDMIENWSTAVTGNRDSFLQFRNFYREEGHSLDEYRQYMDVEEFANFFILNIFYDNKDFPCGNIVQWRPKEENGKWRWLVKDIDFGLGLSDLELNYEYPTLKWITNKYEDSYYDWGNQSYGTTLLCNLLEIDEFKELFITKSAVALGDFLRPEKVIALIDKEENDIKTDIEIMNTLYPRWLNFSTEVQKTRDWMKGRVPFFYQDLADYFNIGNPVPMEINAEGFDVENISINETSLSEPYFNGKWFAGSTVIINSTDDKVKSFRVETEFPDDYITTTYSENPLTLTVPTCKTIKIQPSDNKIDSFVEDSISDSIINLSSNLTVYSLEGRYLGTFENLDEVNSKISKGVYIVKTKSAVFKHKI